MIYEIAITPVAHKSLHKIHFESQCQISKAIDELALNPRPHGYKKLVGQGKSYRIRVGNYRIIYSINDKIVTVLILQIDHRKDAYK